MTFIATFIVLTVAGIIDAGYLYYSHRSKKNLVCPLDGDCNRVVESRWATFFGIRNDFLGLLFYTILFIVALLLPQWPEQRLVLTYILTALTGTGLLYSIYLTYLQIRVIQDFCMYCLISAGLVLLLFLNSLALRLN